ncbi:uncharacterized protein LOC105862812 [Microcebus murinus]|uniref:uncharacterized protein LOC105862812 n=1 Tax=Microcebus murinus TaxID=30608 RepID=UPI003F6B534D
MADGGHDLTVRMSTEDQNIDGRLNYDYIFSYFKRFKVKISHAIEKTFPFLELLRDHEFITNEMFEDCQASCRNLVPVNNVIYSILDELEKKFNLEVLKILFDDDNIKEYPGLIPIYKTFLNVLPDKWYLQGIDEKGREEGPSCQLTLEQGTGENSFPSLPGPHLDSSFSTGTTPPESGLLEHLCETEQANTRRHDTTGDKNDELGHPQANQQCAQEPEPPGTICEDSEKPNDGDGPLGASISALEGERDKKVISDYGSSDLGKKEAQEATRSRPQIAPERKTANPGPLKRRSSRRSKRRVSRFPRDESMNFLLPELPVTCGDIKGILYKEKLKQGTSEKCIKSETRRWFTLRRFEIKGGYEKTSNWKLSIRCGGFTLKELIERGYLQKPPKGKKKQVDSKETQQGADTPILQVPQSEKSPPRDRRGQGGTRHVALIGVRLPEGDSAAGLSAPLKVPGSCSSLPISTCWKLGGADSVGADVENIPGALSPRPRIPPAPPAPRPWIPRPRPRGLPVSALAAGRTRASSRSLRTLCGPRAQNLNAPSGSDAAPRLSPPAGHLPVPSGSPGSHRQLPNESVRPLRSRLVRPGSATGLGESRSVWLSLQPAPSTTAFSAREEETWSLPPFPVALPTSWKAEAAEANLEPRPLPWTQAKKTGGTEGRALRMAGGGHELYIGSRATQPRTPNNSFPVCLMDIKKKPLFNSEDEQQAQARTNHNQASDIIVITNEDSEKCNDGDEPLGAPLSALEMIKEYGSSKSPEREETQEATCSQPQNTPDPVNIGNTSTCCIRKRKRPLRAQIVQCPNCSTVITNEDSEESNDGDEPLGAPLSALEMSYIDYLLKSIEGQDTQASTCSGPQNAPALLPLEASLQFREANPVGRLPTPVIQAAFFTSHSKSREPGSLDIISNFLTFLRYTISLSTLCCLCLREDWQRKWAEQSSQGLQSNSYPVHLMDKTKKKTSINSGDEQQAQARTNHNQASDIIVISSEDSEESNDEEKPPRASISALEMVKEYGFSESHEREETQEATCSQPQNAPGADLQRPEKEKCSCVMCFSSGVPTSQEATAESSQTPDMMENLNRITGPIHFINEEIGTYTTDAGNNSALKKHSGKRRGKRRHIANVKSLQRSKKKYQRIPKDKSMNFQLPKLPVTCGKAKGTLNKKKLKRGTSKRCIKSEAGRWLTLREFEILGGYRLSKNWKLSVRCGGYTLKELIENGHIQNPPRTRTPENSNICVVCKTWGTLLCCDTCPRSFHENCHIPPVEPERNGWSCIFCKIKVIQGRCPESQPRRQESEVLRMQMLPEEQLKCEFLLLKVYCYSKTLFIASKPYYSRVGSQGPQRPKWLDNVKKSLNKKKYPQVKGFVGDMRLVFQNDKLLYRKNKSTRLILKVQKNFEKNFKNIFAIQETSKNNSPL